MESSARFSPKEVSVAKATSSKYFSTTLANRVKDPQTFSGKNCQQIFIWHKSTPGVVITEVILL